MSATTMAGQMLLPETYTNLVLPAAIQDMEFRSSLPAARHYVENLLAAFSAAVGTTDTAKLIQLLQGVDIRVDGRELQPGQGPEQVVSQFSPEGHPSLIVTNNLSVRHADGGLMYTCTYQAWSADTPVSFTTGTLQGRLNTGPQVWKWASHDIHRWGKTAD